MRSLSLSCGVAKTSSHEDWRREVIRGRMGVAERVLIDREGLLPAVTQHNRPSKVEIAKVLRQLKAVSTPEQHARITQILHEGSATVDSVKPATPIDAIEGLSQEDEFLMLCFLMGTATHLAPLDQRPSIAARSAAPDLLARFQPPFSDYAGDTIPHTYHNGFRCLIEVKSTKNHKFTIKGGALRRLRAFADQFSLPLVFAVRFTTFQKTALWAIVEDSDRSKNSMTVDASAVLSGLRPMLWHEHGYMLMPNTYLQMTYDSSGLKSGIRSTYGTLVGLQLINPMKRHVIPEQDVPMTAALLEGFLPEEVEAQSRGTITQVAYKLHNKMLMVADIIFAMNHLARDDSGNIAHDPLTAFRELADGQQPHLIDRAVVEAVAAQLCQMGAAGLMGLGRPERNYNHWVRTGGVPPSGYCSPKLVGT